MFRKLVFIVIFLFLFPTHIYAAEQFAESYAVKYEIQDNGDAVVTEQVTIRNLTDTFFGSNYVSAIPTQNVTEISAKDTYRPLQVSEKKEVDKTLITVSFPEQIIGKDKQYSWTLQYRLSNFVQTNGLVRQFFIPKLSAIKNLEKYDLTLSLPLSLGEPTQLTPKPLGQRDIRDETEYRFDKAQIEQSGINSIFGSSQNYNLEQQFSIFNQGLLPIVQPIFIPGSGLYQEIIISEISPKPENVVIDKNGNSLAYFKLNRLETMNISVKGKAKVDLERSSVDVPSAEKLPMLVESNGVWDATSPQVQKALENAFEGEQHLTTMQKAQKIYEYITSAVEFGDYGVTSSFTQSSASSILTDPKNRFCSDYVNVSIAMLRAAQIPAEQVVGAVFTNNLATKPSCYLTKDQHTWVRFLDTQKGWVYMDPSWGAAGNGLTFFDSTDLSHVAVSYLIEPKPIAVFANKTSLNFSQDEFLPQFSLKSEVVSSQELIAGFPYTITFRISNSGNNVLPPGSFKVSAKQLQLKPKDTVVSDDEFMYPSIPPFGYVDYEFTTKSGLAWQSFTDIVSLTTGNDVTFQQITVKPLFSSKFFSAIVLGITFGMLSLYILVLILHYKSKTIFESAQEAVSDIAKIIAPIVPGVKISGSATKNVIKTQTVKVSDAKKKTKTQKFRRKKKTD